MKNMLKGFLLALMVVGLNTSAMDKFNKTQNYYNNHLNDLKKSNLPYDGKDIASSLKNSSDKERELFNSALQGWPASKYVAYSALANNELWQNFLVNNDIQCILLSACDNQIVQYLENDLTRRRIKTLKITCEQDWKNAKLYIASFSYNINPIVALDISKALNYNASTHLADINNLHKTYPGKVVLYIDASKKNYQEKLRIFVKKLPNFKHSMIRTPVIAPDGKDLIGGYWRIIKDAFEDTQKNKKRSLNKSDVKDKSVKQIEDFLTLEEVSHHQFTARSHFISQLSQDAFTYNLSQKQLEECINEIQALLVDRIEKQNFELIFNNTDISKEYIDAYNYWIWPACYNIWQDIRLELLVDYCNIAIEYEPEDSEEYKSENTTRNVSFNRKDEIRFIEDANHKKENLKIDKYEKEHGKGSLENFWNNKGILTQPETPITPNQEEQLLKRHEDEIRKSNEEIRIVSQNKDTKEVKSILKKSKK